MASEFKIMNLYLIYINLYFFKINKFIENLLYFLTNLVSDKAGCAHDTSDRGEAEYRYSYFCCFVVL